MNITEFLEARIAEDEAVARAATDPDRPGMHWHWVTNRTDTPVPPEDIDEALNYQNISLRTVEEFPTAVRPLPAFLVNDIDEMNPGAGAHIIRHDPSRVLAECAAKRAIVAEHEAAVIVLWPDMECIDVEVCTRCGVPAVDDEYVAWPCPTLSALAAVHADHPDYREEWA